MRQNFSKVPRGKSYRIRSHPGGILKGASQDQSGTFTAESTVIQSLQFKVNRIRYTVRLSKYRNSGVILGKQYREAPSS